MSINYTPITDFLTKDTLPKEDPDKVILGADFSAEFEAISTAFLGAVTSVSPTFTGTVTFEDASGQTLTLSSNATVGGTLGVTGNTTVGGTLGVTGATTLTNTTVNGTLNATGNTTIGGTLAATGTITSGGSPLQSASDVQAAISAAELNSISTLDNLANVDETGKASGDFLSYNGTNWVPEGFTSLTGDITTTGTVLAHSYHETKLDVTSTSNVTLLDCTAATVFRHVLTENTTITPALVPATGTAFACVLEVEQDAGASGFVVSWPAGTVWADATAPTLTATASATDVFVLMTHDGGTTWYGFVSGQAFA